MQSNYLKEFCLCIIADLHTSLSHKEVTMRLTMLRMNVSFMEYMRKKYENLYSKPETIESQISSDLRELLLSQTDVEIDAR